MRIQATFLNEAKALLGDRGFTCDTELMEPWLTDWRGRFTGKALGIASPASTAETADFVKLCAKHGVPIVPQGGNSGMSGGATPDNSGSSVILSLRRMDRIRHFDADARQISCEAGVILQNLHDEVAKHDLRFPLTLGGKGSATIGGLISTNAGGTQVLRHGTMRAQVLGIEAVLADGQIFDRLTALKKDNRGFDLKQLLIGSEGTLGIITAASLRLVPAIRERVVSWVGLNSIAEARKLLLRLEKSLSDELEGFEIVPAHCLESVLGHVPDARAPLNKSYAWNALIEFVTTDEDGGELRRSVEAELEDSIEQGIAADAVLAMNESQAEQFWLLRDSIAPAERALGPAVQHDISVPVEQMPSFVTNAIKSVEQAYPGVQGVAFGHLGDGNIHFHVLAPKSAQRGVWEKQEGKEISRFVHDLVTDIGGSISAEHGIGQLKRDELERLADPVAITMMQQVKQALDPKELLNPGKLVPLAREETKS